jgi:hypothetical protein
MNYIIYKEGFDEYPNELDAKIKEKMDYLAESYTNGH